MADSLHTILIECPDRKGLVHQITEILFAAGLNITKNREFVDEQKGRFFMRTEVSGALDQEGLAKRLRVALTGEKTEEPFVRVLATRPKRIVVLATKEHHALGDLLIRNFYQELKAEIVAVVSNHEYLRDLVAKFGIPYHYVAHQGLEREEHEGRVLEIIDGYQPEYLVLAKYMRVLSPNFVDCYRGRIINIHHSFLPAFVGAKPYHQAYERGVKIIGATAHFVSDDLDEGPIIAQDVIPVDHTFSAEEMIGAGRDVEKTVLAKALKLVFEDRVFINGNKTVVF